MNAIKGEKGNVAAVILFITVLWAMFGVYMIYELIKMFICKG